MCMKHLPFCEFVALQKKGALPKDAVIIDVRMDGEYTQSHLDDAINIDVSHPNFLQEIALLDKTKPYYLYCASGGLSQAAAAMMEAAGFSNVYNLLGGMMALS